jgi:uncharacterized membrane protein HdeD (DUF308 family)
MKTSYNKSPDWLRVIQIGLGIITVILSIFALQFPADAFLAAVVVLGIILFIVGIEKIITGIFLPIKGKWATIGLGMLVLLFAALAVSFPKATALILTIFVGIGLIFNGCARIIEGNSGRHSGWAKIFLIGVGILSIVIGTVVLASPIIGVVFVGLIIAIGLLITGIQMIAVGAAGKRIVPDTPSTTDT